MASFKSSSSMRRSVYLIPTVLLLIAISGANCEISVLNRAQHYFDVFNIMSAKGLAITPGYEYFLQVPSAANLTEVPAPEVLYLEKYSISPDANASISGTKGYFATLWVGSNATITFADTPVDAANFTTARTGFTVDYL